MQTTGGCCNDFAGCAIAADAKAGKKSANGEDTEITDKQLIGSKSTNNWNLKENVVATFDWKTLNCHICTKKNKMQQDKKPFIWE